LLASHIAGMLGPMKTTLDLPDDLVREVKLRAVLQRRTVKDLVAELLRQGLGAMSPGRLESLATSARVSVGTSGLPFFQCAATAPATTMSADELLKLERDTLSQEDVTRAGIAS
jgi:plasmid stability protein